MFAGKSAYPLKIKETLLPGRDRIYMTGLGNSRHFYFRTSILSLHAATFIYIVTLTLPQRKTTRNRMHWLMGEDNLYTLHK
jgi:nicotinic acid mononucleotide adenylyltransferase